MNDLNLELTTLAQSITVGDKDIDSAIKDFKTAANALIDIVWGHGRD